MCRTFRVMTPAEMHVQDAVVQWCESWELVKCPAHGRDIRPSNCEDCAQTLVNEAAFRRAEVNLAGAIRCARRIEETSTAPTKKCSHGFFSCETCRWDGGEPDPRHAPPRFESGDGRYEAMEKRAADIFRLCQPRAVEPGTKR